MLSAETGAMVTSVKQQTRAKISERLCSVFNIVTTLSIDEDDGVAPGRMVMKMRWRPEPSSRRALSLARLMRLGMILFVTCCDRMLPRVDKY